MRTSIQICILSLVALIIGVAAPRVNAQCPADLNGDGQINQADVAQLLANSGPVPFPPPVIPPIVPAWATLLEAAPNPAVVTDANLRAAIVASGLAWRVRDNGTNIEMLLVPAGTFTMGCSASDPPVAYGGVGCASDEIPTRQVTLTQAFYMGRYEVTQAQWTATMGSNPSYFHGQLDSPSRPVERVSWNMIASGSTLRLARSCLSRATKTSSTVAPSVNDFIICLAIISPFLKRIV